VPLLISPQAILGFFSTIEEEMEEKFGGSSWAGSAGFNLNGLR
jgi:hypothetical protein